MNLIGVIASMIFLVGAFYYVIGNSERGWSLVRVAIAISIGLPLIVCILGPDSAFGLPAGLRHRAGLGFLVAVVLLLALALIKGVRRFYARRRRLRASWPKRALSLKTREDFARKLPTRSAQRPRTRR